MSILIKSMEMPKDTCEIRITIDQDGDWWARRIDTDGEWHEVVEVPTPHGRLIDADALSQIYRFDDYGKAVVDCEDMDNAPTIIEAEVDDG